MRKKSSPSSMAGRAWRLLRLSLLWAKRGNRAFRQKLILDLRPVPNYLKSLRRPASLHYGERQFSFDDSPAFHFKMHRPASMRHLHIPCITAPAVDFDEYDDYVRESFQIEPEAFSPDVQSVQEVEGLPEVEEEGGIDMKAEEFIAKFYQQMKLQRQVSLLQHNEMLHRGIS